MVIANWTVQKKTSRGLLIGLNMAIRTSSFMRYNTEKAWLVVIF